jgi:hypothetical protein
MSTPPTHPPVTVYTVTLEYLRNIEMMCTSMGTLIDRYKTKLERNAEGKRRPVTVEEKKLMGPPTQ